MATFKDREGTEWTVEVNPHTIKICKKLTGWNLGLALQNDCKLLDEILGDPSNVIDVVYCLCKEQADLLGISDVEFGKRCTGDAIEDSLYSFVEAFADFCPSQDRKALMTIWAMTKQMRESTMSLFNETLTSFAGNLEESRGSTPSDEA